MVLPNVVDEQNFFFRMDQVEESNLEKCRLKEEILKQKPKKRKLINEK